MRLLRPIALLLLATACGGDAPDTDAETEAEPTAAAEATTALPMPTEPHVMAIDIGIAVDDSGRIMGAGVEAFPAPAPLFVSIRTQATPAGMPLAARLVSGTRTVDSTSGVAAAPEASGIGRTTLTLAKAAGLAPGEYRVEVFLDGASVGIREFRFNAP
jgi:hypothetical protein